MKTEKYNVVARDARTGMIRPLGEIVAAGKKEAEKMAVVQFFTSYNMMKELLDVVKV